MSRFVITCALLLLAPGSSMAQTPAADTTSKLFREISALNRAMEASVVGGSAKGAAAFYADDAIVRTPRRIVVRGREAVDRYFAQISNALSWKLDVIQVGGHVDAPWQVGKSTLISGTRPDTSVVNFVVYWRRQPDGKLKIELDYYQ